ncbi:MAG: head GIN domain-containing protein [Spirosomataceae bacterium]
MKKISFTLLMVAFVTMSFAQTALKPFGAVSLHGCMRVEMVKGDTESIKIEGDAAETAEVKVNVSKEGLSVKKSWKNDVLDKHGCDCNKVRITLTYKSVNSFKTGWGVQVNVQNPVKENEVLVEASSGSEITLEAYAKNLEAQSSSGAIVKIAGRSESVFVKSNTDGEVLAYNLDCEDVEAKANTGGVVKVMAKNSLEASAGTGGEIKYKGQPKHRSFSRSLGGEIHGY